MRHTECVSSLSGNRLAFFLSKETHFLLFRQFLPYCSVIKTRCASRGCQALQEVIYAGADVRVELAGRWCGVLNVEAVGENAFIYYITRDAPEEQCAVIAGTTPFSVAFSEA